MSEKYCILYAAETEQCELPLSDGEVRRVELTESLNFGDFLKGLESDEKLVLLSDDCGLNLFANKSSGFLEKREVFYYPAGKKKAFYRDIAQNPENPQIVEISRYLHNLPSVRINGKLRKFVNGISFGLDAELADSAGNSFWPAAKKILFGVPSWLLS